jgi:ABC-type dipeptide/oligopeptide/nickel transport system permease subunit
VPKHKKRASGGIIQGRQGPDHKNQDLFVRILIGGRTGLQIGKTAGAL